MLYIKEAREAANLSQKELADIIGVAPTTFHGYESGKHDPKSDLLLKIARACETTVDFLLGNDQKKAAPGMSPEAEKIAKRYDRLDAVGQGAVDAIVDYEEKRMESAAGAAPVETKIIPLFGASFAAGYGEPDFGNAWEDYEVPAESPADFAVRISGDSMEPHLKDGSIALCRKETPKDGDVAALLVDGEFLVKQVCEDPYGNVYLFSLNRARSDADRTLWAKDADAHSLTCFGTVILPRRLPLP